MLLLALAARAQEPPKSPSQTTPAQPAPAVPPKSLSLGEWNASFAVQDVEGNVSKLRGGPGRPAELVNSSMLFRADEIDYDRDTGDLRASGHVYYHNFDRNEQIWVDRLTYNTDTEEGKFYDFRRETHPHII